MSTRGPSVRTLTVPAVVAFRRSPVAEMAAREERYLLKLWCDGSKSDDWRASLRDLLSEDTWHFGTVDQLMKHLAAITQADVDSGHDG